MQISDQWGPVLPPALGKPHKDWKWLDRERLIVKISMPILMTAIFAGFLYHCWDKYWVEPAYHQAVEQLYNEKVADGQTVYIPRWVPKSYMPVSLETGDRLILTLDIGEQRRITFSQGHGPITYDADVDRTLTRNRRHDEFTYAEKWVNGTVIQWVTWQFGETGLCFRHQGVTAMKLDTLWKLALGVKAYTTENPTWSEVAA